MRVENMSDIGRFVLAFVFIGSLMAACIAAIGLILFGLAYAIIYLRGLL